MERFDGFINNLNFRAKYHLEPMNPELRHGSPVSTRPDVFRVIRHPQDTIPTTSFKQIINGIQGLPEET